MSDKTLQNWIAIRSWMSDEQRENMVRSALDHLGVASNDLRLHAQAELGRGLNLSGSRLLKGGLDQVVKLMALQEMRRIPFVASTLVCLWAEANQEMIANLRIEAERAGFIFAQNWNWEDARRGYYTEAHLPRLAGWLKEYSKDFPQQQQQDLLLAMYWLSRAVLYEPETPITPALQDTLIVTEQPCPDEPEYATPSTIADTKIMERTASYEFMQDGNRLGADKLVLTLLQELTDSHKPQSKARTPSSPLLQLETTTPIVAQPAGETVQSEVEEAKPISLEAMVHDLQNLRDQTRQAKEKSLLSGQRIVQAIQEDHLPALNIRITELQDQIRDWQAANALIQQLLRQSYPHLQDQIALRPELAGDLPANSESLSVELLDDLLERIANYDQQKQSLLENLHQLQAENVQLQDLLTFWLTDEKSLDQAQSTPGLTSVDTDLILSSIQEQIKTLKNEVATAKERLAHFRELAANRILNTASRLAEFESTDDEKIFEDYTTSQIPTLDFTDFSGPRLRALEQALTVRLDEKILLYQAMHREETAVQLLGEWQDAQFMQLLNHLAEQRRDAEVLLLLIAANRVHPRQNNLILNRNHVASIITGVGQLADLSNPFKFLGALAPDLCTGWSIEDRQTLAELSIIFLGVYYDSTFELPSGFLWERIALDWPIPAMIEWKRLWEAALEEIPLEIRVITHDIWAKLQEAEALATSMLEFENGLFVRAASARKSTRHMHLLNNILLPQYSDILKEIQGFASLLQEDTERDIEEYIKLIGAHCDKELIRDLRSAFYRHSSDFLPLIVEVIQKIMEEDFLTQFDASSVEDFYEASAASEGIKDPDPFHRRNVIGVLKDCSDALKSYCEALIAYCENELEKEQTLSSRTLKAELESFLPTLSSLGQAAFDRILSGKQRGEPWTDEAGHKYANQLIVQKLLSEASYAMRLPRLVGHLTGTRLSEWQHTLRHLLEDIAQPLNKISAAQTLLDAQAPDQVLLFASSLPLETQIKAQAQKRELERDVDIQVTELLSAGGQIEDISQDRQLGRWQLLKQELGRKIFDLKNAADTAKRQSQEQARQLLHEINELSLEIFDRQSELQEQVFALLYEGLNIARNATTKGNLMAQVRDYLAHFRYRLSHNSYDELDLQQANEQMERVIADVIDGSTPNLCVDFVLARLESSEFRRLGLRQDDLSASMVATRIDFLNQWLAVRKLPSLLSANLSIAQQNNIFGMFSKFAELTSLKRVKTLENKNLEYTTPLVYSYWQLQYPKTSVLERDCVLIALPGTPPSPEDITELQNFILEKQLLTNFVIIFVPGCTPKLKQRLENFKDPHATGRHLVVIDEAVILRMILAEKEGINPLGKLRPLLLNALLQKIDIFTINAEVDAQTAIFVGRDHEIERIASSGENFAVYGGRRIGKSSLLKAIYNLLQKRGGTQAVWYSFEGQKDFDEDSTARALAIKMEFKQLVNGIGDFRNALQQHLNQLGSKKVVLFLDEVDKYIECNETRHILIEILRSVSNETSRQLRVVIAGFMNLYDCLKGNGPYTPTSDPWSRLLNDIGPLGNLPAANAEMIVKEGFISVLGWQFENRAIPQKIVEMTGGHPAFVQKFCLKLQDQVSKRRNKTVLIDDLRAVFEDTDPSDSFIAYVRSTMYMNLNDPVSKYLIIWLSLAYGDSKSFTLAQLKDLVNQSSIKIPDRLVDRTLDKLVVNSVVRERAPQMYEFTVPDYPTILNRLGSGDDIDYLEDAVRASLGG